VKSGLPVVVLHPWGLAAYLVEVCVEVHSLKIKQFVSPVDVDPPVALTYPVLHEFKLVVQKSLVFDEHPFW